ncbi:hypothetical protein BSPLISOX_1068 [uncultured Gammaproteobacteria bacterium]|jgi:hypothetical protein|nr:hypothetical protein BSPLISOX_1068 [uncultured Gammaproteobacteria bacterium]
MIIQFTETFEKTALFFPQYICIGKINELGEYDNFYNLYNLIFEDYDTISECLTDPQIIMSWEILIQLEAQISKKNKIKERLLNLKEISVKRIRRRFRDAIYDELSYLKDIKTGKVKYIDDYSEKWEKSWKLK